MAKVGWLRVPTAEEFAERRRPAPAGTATRTMPVRRGHVAHQNTFLDTIIRKFEGQSKFEFIRVHDANPLVVVVVVVVLLNSADFSLKCEFLLRRTALITFYL